MVTLGDVYAARSRLAQRVRRTPFEHAPLLSRLCDAEIWLKLENRQLTGSFKIRGACNRMALLTAEQRSCGVVTASSGNHAQGVALAARELGIPAVIVVPVSTPETKCEAIRALGAELTVHGAEYMEAERLAQQLSAARAMTFISPYDDADLIAGQGTVALEMLEDGPALDLVVVPVAGGGLISGVATVVKTASPARVIGVQTEASPVMHRSVEAGQVVAIPLRETVAEGLHGGLGSGSITFPMCRDLVDDWLDVPEAAIVEALRLMLLRQHEVVEGAGAVGVAALLTDARRFEGHRVGVILTGGNIDDALLRRVAAG